MIGRRELRRRLRAALRPAADEAQATEALWRILGGDEELTKAARAFLVTRRDVLSAVQSERLAEGAPPLMRETWEEGDEPSLRREVVFSAELPSRVRRLAPLWKEVARCWAPTRHKAVAARLRDDFARWLARRLDVRSTARALARLPSTSVRVASPVLLSRSSERAVVLAGPVDERADERTEHDRRDTDSELPQAAWLAQAFEAGWVFENPAIGVWHRGEGNTIHVLDGPVVCLDARSTRRLERYVSATLLERRDAATDALVQLLETMPDESAVRELRGQVRQLVPDRDRLDGDWRDRGENNLLGHWRLVTERKLHPHPGLVAFWSGLAVWERRGGDLRAALQRWLASRTADALCSDTRYRWLTILGEQASSWLDRPVVGD